MYLTSSDYRFLSQLSLPYFLKNFIFSFESFSSFINSRNFSYIPIQKQYVENVLSQCASTFQLVYRRDYKYLNTLKKYELIILNIHIICNNFLAYRIIFIIIIPNFYIIYGLIE
ncbi:hypothetical protein pb186bvf_007060 [Paramecium bursaria]